MTGDTVPWEPGTHPSVTSTHKKTLKEEFTTIIIDHIEGSEICNRCGCREIEHEWIIDRLTTTLVQAVTHRLDRIIV